MPIEIDPKRTGLKATPTKFELVDDCLPDRAEPGSFEMRTDFVLLACPGCGRLSGMTAGYPKPSRKPSWEISGDPATPTFNPSINCVGCCGWHGYLRNGVFESC